VYLQPTDIFRTPAMIKACVDCLKDKPEFESATVAYKTHKNFWRGSPETGFKRVAGDMATYLSRQYRKEFLYREDTGVASATRAKFPRSGQRLGDKVDLIVTEDFRTGIDIHSEFDLWLAEKVLTDWKERF
jgi:CMP-N,N'-diacetyllegionaminic acid synthase